MQDKKGIIQFGIPLIIISGIILLAIIGIGIYSQIPYMQNQYKIGTTRDVEIISRDTTSTISDTNCIMTLNVDGEVKDVTLNQCLNTDDAMDLMIRKSEGSGIASASFCESNFANLEGDAIMYTLIDKGDDSLCYGVFAK